MLILVFTRMLRKKDGSITISHHNFVGEGIISIGNQFVYIMLSMYMLLIFVVILEPTIIK